MKFEDMIGLFDNKIPQKITGALDIYFNGETIGLNELRKGLQSSTEQQLILLKVKIS